MNSKGKFFISIGINYNKWKRNNGGRKSIFHTHCSHDSAKTHSVLFSSLQLLSRVLLFTTHELQHTRPACPLPTPRVYPNPCPLSPWCHPTISSSVVPFSSCPESFPASGSFNESVLCIRWPKCKSFSFNISPSNEDPGLISFRMNWLYLLAVQGTLKSLLQHHSSKASILQCWAFYTVQLSHLYMTTGKIIAVTRRTFVDKVMSLLFNMLYRLVITFLPRSKHLLISWLQSPSTVILEPKNIVSHCFYCFPIYLSWSESGEWKNWLKAQRSEHEVHGIRSHHFMGNRCGNSGWLYFSGLQNHCTW